MQLATQEGALIATGVLGAATGNGWGGALLGLGGMAFVLVYWLLKQRRGQAPRLPVSRLPLRVRRIAYRICRRPLLYGSVNGSIAAIVTVAVVLAGTASTARIAEGVLFGAVWGVVSAATAYLYARELERTLDVNNDRSTD